MSVLVRDLFLLLVLSLNPPLLCCEKILNRFTLQKNVTFVESENAQYLTRSFSAMAKMLCLQACNIDSQCMTAVYSTNSSCSIYNSRLNVSSGVLTKPMVIYVKDVGSELDDCRYIPCDSTKNLYCHSTMLICKKNTVRVTNNASTTVVITIKRSFNGTTLITTIGSVLPNTVATFDFPFMSFNGMIYASGGGGGLILPATMCIRYSLSSCVITSC